MLVNARLNATCIIYKFIIIIASGTQSTHGFVLIPLVTRESYLKLPKHSVHIKNHSLLNTQ